MLVAVLTLYFDEVPSHQNVSVLEALGAREALVLIDDVLYCALLPVLARNVVLKEQPWYDVIVEEIGIGDGMPTITECHVVNEQVQPVAVPEIRIQSSIIGESLVVGNFLVFH